MSAAADVAPLWGGDLDDASVKYADKITTATLQLQLREFLNTSKKSASLIFREWDTDHSGGIDCAEFRVAVRALGFSASDEEVDALFALLDANESGSFAYADMSELLHLSSGKQTKAQQDSTWHDATQRSILLKQLSKAELKYVRQSCKSTTHGAGHSVYQQGDIADASYFVQSGKYVATVHTPAGERKLREYSQGDNFGSCELLSGELRTCSVTCVVSGEVWLVVKRVFQDKLRVAAPPKRAVIERVKAIPLFAQAEMPAAQISQICRAATELRFDAGELICENDEPARHIYAIVAGDAVATHAKGEYVMKPPTSFGESALYAEEELRTRNAAVHAGLMGCTILAFDVAHIEALIGFSLHAKSVHSYNRKMLVSVQIGGSPITEGLSAAEIDWLVEALVEESHESGEVVGGEGTADDKLQIIKRGTATVTTTKGKNGPEKAVLQVGDYFGELSLIKKRSRRASVIADPPHLLTISLSADLVKENTALDEWREALFRKDAASTSGGKESSSGEKKGDDKKHEGGEGGKSSKARSAGGAASEQKRQRGRPEPRRGSYAETLIAQAAATAAALVPGEGSASSTTSTATPPSATRAPPSSTRTHRRDVTPPSVRAAGRGARASTRSGRPALEATSEEDASDLRASPGHPVRGP